MSTDLSLLSTKKIPPAERLIFALDVPDLDAARALIARLGDQVRFYKLGLELLMAGDYFALVDELVGAGKRVFLDLKFFDIPATVSAAVRQLRGRGASFVTVHGNQAILEAACAERGELKVLAVTALTSLDRDDLVDLGFPEGVDVEDLVLSRARRALACGCDGVISSGLEARRLREELGERLLVVTPGIRPVDNRREDEQKRVMTPRQAFLAGADHIVVGRPIRDADDPAAVAGAIQDEIAALFCQV
ncbi:MAG: orotidine-5'-phosphate decarboxylase [Myxococcota bacterium]|nr:orotidine-5'-phosphate decarboxylase [Myxococcota bacterium]